MTGTGSPNVLQEQDVAIPEIQSPTQILVELKAAAINPIDTKLRSGAYPFNGEGSILGCDGAGVVKEVGSDVTRFKQGDEVYFFYGGIAQFQGNYAEYIVVEETFIAHKPSNINFIQAAAFPLVTLTAWESLFDRVNLEKDQTVLIHAGAGGVGHIAIQLAKAHGAKVAATISSDEKAEFVKQLGADKIINYKTSNFAEESLAWTNGEGVDVVMDNVGTDDIIEQSFLATKYYGDVVTLLMPSNNLNWKDARMRNQSFHFEVMLSPLLFDLPAAQAHQGEILEQAKELIEVGKLTTHVTKVFPLNEVQQAHEMLEAGSVQGKIVLEI